MNEKINLQELIGLLAEKSDITKKEADVFLREFFDLMTEVLVSEKQIKIKNLGAFKLAEVEDRESVDVRTGERVLIPSHLKIIYSPDKYLSETVNEPFALFESVEVESEEALMTEVKDVPVIETSEKEALLSESETNIPDKEVVEPESKILITNSQYALNQTEYHSVKKKINRKTIGFLIVMLMLIGVFSYFILKDNSSESNNVYQIPPPKTAFDLAQEDSFKKMNSMVSDSLSGKIDSDSINRLDTSRITTFKEIIPISQVKQEILKEVVQEPEKKEIPKEISKVAGKKETVQVAVKIPEKKGGQSNLKKRTIAPGERLTVIALEEYGNKIFWVYLYEENKELIKNPNNVTSGLEIVVPPAGKYKIDKDNPESICKALELSKSYR